MMYLIVGITIGLLLGYLLLRKNKFSLTNSIRRSKKQARLSRVIELAAKKNKITNTDVQKLLKVSNTTANRYLNTLENQGTLSQKGKAGRSVYYTLKH